MNTKHKRSKYIRVGVFNLVPLNVHFVYDGMVFMKKRPNIYYDAEYIGKAVVDPYGQLHIEEKEKFLECKSLHDILLQKSRGRFITFPMVDVYNAKDVLL